MVMWKVETNCPKYFQVPIIILHIQMWIGGANHIQIGSLMWRWKHLSIRPIIKWDCMFHLVSYWGSYDYFKFKDNICFKTNNEFQIFCHFDVGTTMTYKIHYKGKHDLSFRVQGVVNLVWDYSKVYVPILVSTTLITFFCFVFMFDMIKRHSWKASPHLNLSQHSHTTHLF
jgi:hypothetical protein